MSGTTSKPTKSIIIDMSREEVEAISKWAKANFVVLVKTPERGSSPTSAR
jgi:hypothetical protein